MSLETFTVGEGIYSLIYGKHIGQGILAGLDQRDPNNVKIKVLLGMGELDAIEELSYEGSTIDPSKYRFHPGTASSGKTDPLQGEDIYFPNGIYHLRIAYYSANIGSFGNDGIPNGMRVIVRGLKVYVFDASGNQVAYQYSVNPADVFADLVRRNSLRLGYDFQSSVDWSSYIAARNYYNATFPVDDGRFAPKNVQIFSGASGSLSAGNYYYRISSLHSDGTSESAASPIKMVPTSASGRNQISWSKVDGASKYRIYFGTSPSVLNQYFEVAQSDNPSYAHTSTSGALSGTPKDLPTGAWQVTAPRFESHRIFTTEDVLTADALTAVCFDAASEWTMDGGKYRILTPETRTSQHRFTVDNTDSDSFMYWKVPPRERVNQVSTVYRRLDDRMKPGEDSPANDFEAQTKFGIVEETLTLGSKRENEQRRIAHWRLADIHQKPRRVKLVGRADSHHLLTTDVVTVIDPQAGVRNPQETRIFSSLNRVYGLQSGAVEWVAENPSPIGKSLSLKVSGTNPRFNFQQTFGHSVTEPVPLSSNSVFRTHIFIDPNNAPSEINIMLSTEMNDYSASFRLPQTASSADGVATRIGIVPPSGTWVPIIFPLKDLGIVDGDTLYGISLMVVGGIASFSEMFTREEAGRDYKVVEIEDSGDKTLYTLYEYNPNAYSDNPA